MKKSHLIGLVIIAIAISVIISTVADSSEFVGFREAAAVPDKEFHITGVLAPGEEIYYNPVKDPNYFYFYLQDQNGEVRKVVYNDSKPQDFERSEQVVTIGKMKGEDFHASRILLKCPSKYEDELIEVKKTAY